MTKIIEVKTILKSGMPRPDGRIPALALVQEKVGHEGWKVLCEIREDGFAGEPITHLMTAKKIIKNWDIGFDVELLIIKQQLLEGGSVNSTNYRILWKAVKKIDITGTHDFTKGELSQEGQSLGDLFDKITKGVK